MLKYFKIYFLITLISFIFVLLAFIAVDYVENEREALAQSKIDVEVQQMRDNLSGMILQKQKSTLAMALSLSNDTNFASHVFDNKIDTNFYNTLIEDFKKYTLYQNIWIQILDENATSLYRSWSDKKGDSLLGIREDLETIIEKKKVSYSISIGKFDLSIKAMVPVYFEKEFVGVVEIISHFNSIAKQLERLGVESVIVVKKEYKEQLKFPFTKIFIDDYYIANFNAPLEKREYLKREGIENYFHNKHSIENGSIIVSSELKDTNNKTIAYFIMFKRTDTLVNLDIDFLMFKSIATFIIFIMLIAVIFSTVLFVRNKKQRKYYKKIIDTSSNIVLVNDTKKLKSVNKVFFQYFTQFDSLEDFLKNHECICDFFIQEKGYISKEVEGKSWIDYLLEHQNSIKNKIKILLNGKVYFFSANASKISSETNEYSIVLTDITLSETYKNDLEKLTITDTLTGIGNRRHFNHKLKVEISRAKRYEHDLSIIVLDIDFFKKINDEFGHDVGDEVLKEYTKLISLRLREGDVFCRIGGEEFVIILPHANQKNALEIAEKFRQEIQNHKKIVPITMSFGATQCIQGEELDFVFKRADAALYEAKRSGRNRVVLK